jgi:hypothetical protein
MRTGVATFYCDLCGRDLDPTERGVYVHVEGYDRKRPGGGTNHLVFRKVTDPPHFAHDACIRLAQRGINVRQQSLGGFE